MTVHPSAPHLRVGAAARGARSAPSFPAAVMMLGLLALAFALRAPLLLAVAASASLWFIAWHLGAWSAASRVERVWASLLVLVLTLSLPIAALRNPTAFAHWTVSLLALGAAFVLTRDLSVYLRASAWLLWAVQAAVLAFLAVNGLDDFPLERILPDTSSNGITSYLVALQVNYCIVRFVLRGRANLATPLITLAICVVGYGRGSILAAATIVAINAASYVDWRRPMHSVGLLVLAATVAGWAYQRHGEDLAGFVEANTKIGSGLYDEHREQQILEYLERMNGITILFGADYEGTSIATDYNNNPHNSFIRGHHVFGLAYIALVTALPFVLMSSRIPRGRRLFASAMLVVMLFRAFTEPILFPTLLDTVYFALCFVLGRAPAPLRALGTNAKGAPSDPICRTA